MAEILVFPGGGRLVAKDQRDHNHLLSFGQPADLVEIAYKHWRAPPALDQGQTSSCVGHGVHQLLKCSPIRNVKNIPDPYWIYHEAQLIDEYPGEDPEILGTSLRAGIKVIQRRGYVQSYKWAFDLRSACNHVLTTGPLLLGLGWRTGMFKTDRDGLIRPTGRLEGGHCILMTGVNMVEKLADGRRGAATILNHWGQDWGNKGRAKIALDDLKWLLEEDSGEAMAVQEILKKPDAVVG